MRLLYVCNDAGIPISGCKGAAVHLRAITAALADLGHTVDLASPHPAPADHPVNNLLDYDNAQPRRSGKALRRWLTECGFDTKVSNEIRSLLYASWASQSLRAQEDAPRPDAIIERLSLFGHTGVDLADHFDVPLVVEVNALLTEESRRYRRLELAHLAEEVEHRVLHRADVVMAVSAPLAEHIAATGVPRDRIAIVPNGVDPAAFPVPADRASAQQACGLGGCFVVGFCGTLKPWHGVDSLVAAFGQLAERVPHARLVLIGEGPAEADLRRQVDGAGLNRVVQFVGPVPHAQIPDWLAALDVAVAPYRPMDPFYFSPLKLFEYMASGCCVVAPRIGQIAELIQDGGNGLAYRAGDVADLARVLCAACDDGAQRQRLGRAARTTIIERHTWRHTALTVERLVQRAGAPRSAPQSQAIRVAS